MAVCAAAGCGGDAGAKAKNEVTITVTSRGYPEEEVLREIYAHALEATGFKVRRRELGQLAHEELEAGKVSGYPDHLETALTETMTAEEEDVPASAKAAYRELKAQFAEKGLVPFPPASFVRTIAVGVPRKAAEAQGLETLADLEGPSRTMGAIERELYCHGPGHCLNVLKRRYGVVFKSFFGIFLREPSALLYKALKTGEADAAILVTTEGELARGKGWLALLEDDEHRLPAANAFWMTSKKVIDEAGPDYERAILAAQKGLTLKVMRKLDAEVELEGKSPSEVAARYLRSR